MTAPHASIEYIAEDIIHEAGHAVAALVLDGFVLISVEVDREDAMIACVHARNVLHERPDTRDPDAARRYAIYAYAGAAAERLLRGRPSLGDDGDEEDALRVLVAHGVVVGASSKCDDAYERVAAALRAEADALVREHADAVRAVAKALDARRKLTADEVRAVIAELPK